MVSNIKKYIMGAITALLLFVYVIKRAVKVGEDKVEQEHTEEVLENVEKAKEVDDNNDDMLVDERIKRMRERANSRTYK